MIFICVYLYVYWYVDIYIERENLSFHKRNIFILKNTYNIYSKYCIYTLYIPHSIYTPTNQLYLYMCAHHIYISLYIYSI